MSSCFVLLEVHIVEHYEVCHMFLDIRLFMRVNEVNFSPDRESCMTFYLVYHTTTIVK